MLSRGCRVAIESGGGSKEAVTLGVVERVLRRDDGSFNGWCEARGLTGRVNLSGRGGRWRVSSNGHV